MPYLTKALQFFQDHSDLIRVFLGSTGVVFFLWNIGRWTVARFKKYRNRLALEGGLGSGSYTRQDIIRATACYIVPDCQDIDPSGAEDWRLRYRVRQNAFSALDDILGPENLQKYSLILADSGMGKTSLLLNYAARHWKTRSRSKHFHLAVIPLGQNNVETQIDSINNKGNTVLFLDALDEDTRAIHDHRKRVAELLELSREFQHTLITCRTQFFPRDEEIPAETGILKVGPIAAGKPREYHFHKLYLSPFNEGQIAAFIRKRFSIVRYRERARAKSIIKRINDLTVRPMVLAHIPDLLHSDSEFKYSFHIYEQIVRAWLQREQPLVKKADELLEFCEVLAVHILAGRQERGSEKISSAELDRLFEDFEETRHGLVFNLVRESLEKWQVQGRSLLNRDASGNWKFAHRSLLEYLATKRLLATDAKLPPALWTDQMKLFCWEKLHEMRERDLPFPEGVGEILFDDVVLPSAALINLRKEPALFESVEQAERKCIADFGPGYPRNWPNAFQVFGPFWRQTQIKEKALIDRDVDALMAQYESLYGTPPALLLGSMSDLVVSAVGLHDFVTDLNWIIVEGVHHPQHDLATADPTSRPPTLMEALSLVPILLSRNTMLHAIVREAPLRIHTSDSLRFGGSICVEVSSDDEHAASLVTVAPVADRPRVVIVNNVDFILDFMRQSEHVKQLLTLQKLLERGKREGNESR